MDNDKVSTNDIEWILADSGLKSEISDIEPQALEDILEGTEGIFTGVYRVNKAGRIYKLNNSERTLNNGCIYSKRITNSW